MRANTFATLVSFIDNEPFATHLPLTIEERGDTIVLTGHVAKANAHVRAFAQIWSASTDGVGSTTVDSHSALPTLAIFTGPHAYVSPTVYENTESVPTWNYIAVHATGTPRAVKFADDSAAMTTMLDAMIAQYDPAYGAQWDALSPRFREGMMRGVVGFEMPVRRLEGKYKLSQNRSAHDQAAVAEKLAHSSDEMDRAVARAMLEHA